MKLLSAYPYHIALLLSFAYATSCTASGIPQSLEGPFISDAEKALLIKPAEEKALESAQQQEPTLADHFKHVLAAGLIKTCEAHQIDELNAHLYAPEDGSTFSSAVSNNGDGLVDRMKRIAGTEPTISISADAVFTPEETNSKNRFKLALLKFAENPDLPCKQMVDSNGNKTVACTIVMTLKEFAALKEEYKNHNP